MKLYQDESWYLAKTNDVYSLHHECNGCGEITIIRGKTCFPEYQDVRVPCSYCRSVCPKNLQGLYNMLVYL